MDPNLSISENLIFVGLVVGLSVSVFLVFPPFWAGSFKRSGVRWTLVGLSLSLLLLLFPPFWYGGPYTMQARQWHFFLDSWQTTPEGGRTPRPGVVDFPMLSLEFLVVGVGVGTAWYLTTLQD